ncbi:MAG: site-specific integrase [Chloracidobacterium sp.]|nr:site-specific integrase [Chloracidobacterium sp.]
MEGRKKRQQRKYWREIKGNLYARLQYQDEAGKWREKLKPISDKRTALRIVEEMRREFLTHGEETLKSDKLLFSELVKEYTAIKLTKATYANGIKISGRRSLEPVQSAVKPLLEHFGGKPIRSIKAKNIENYKQKRINTPTDRGTTRKISSVNRELELLRAILNFAFQNEWIIKNPFMLSKGIISKASEVERERILSTEEESRLLSVCTGRRAHLRPLLICALDTAMRRGEIFKMKWQDVSFATNEIYIPQSNTKTESSRTVGMTPRLKRELEKLWEASPKAAAGLVFGITTTIKTAFGSACKEAGIEDFRFHDCRHTATTRMIASGSPHSEVMKITGHSQMKTFLRYLNITAERANSVAFRLQEYLSNRTSPPEVSSDHLN